ncbi:MAG: GatB/YqeY domain-containing protein [Gammaproteobacteria bacterium]
MSDIKARLTEAMKAAMRAQDKERLGAVRLALSAIKQIEVDERRELSDADVLAVLDKMVKQRRESVAQYEQAGRAELAAAENAEIVVLQEFLPAQLSEAEIDALVAQAITESGAAGMRDMGKVMNLLRPQLAGRADMGAVSNRIKARLGG